MIQTQPSQALIYDILPKVPESDTGSVTPLVHTCVHTNGLNTQAAHITLHNGGGDSSVVRAPDS